MYALRLITVLEVNQDHTQLVLRGFIVQLAQDLLKSFPVHSPHTTHCLDKPPLTTVLIALKDTFVRKIFLSLRLALRGHTCHMEYSIQAPWRLWVTQLETRVNV